MKLCIKCNENERSHGARCQSCINISARANRYNISEDQVKELLKIKQCQICGDKCEGKDKVIDHDHETGIVRGILCRSCNLAIGNFKEDKERVINAYKYLTNEISISSDKGNSKRYSDWNIPQIVEGVSTIISSIIKYFYFN